MKNINQIISGLLVTMLIVSCGDKWEIVKDNRPDIPVNFDGATTVGFNPYYTVSFAGNVFTITVSIPSSAKHKIKEITNIVAGATSINVASITAASSIQYLAAPVSVNGTTYTLSTSIAEFNTKVPASAQISSAPAAGTLVERAFMLKLTMDDDSVIIPMQCRIRITP
jgi:hypothetical protein